jgi:Uma2 family endonuclease
MSTLAKFSVVQYERMIASGAFAGKNYRRLELIRGELREMNPIGARHAMVVDQVAEWSFDSAPREKVWGRVQNPVAFADLDSEPEPDIVWAVRRNYEEGHPAGQDVLLLIEVADSSLECDRGEKSELYAEAGVQEYWIVNLVDRTIEVRREPREGRYREAQIHGAGAVVTPLAAPQASLSVNSIFGPPK